MASPGTELQTGLAPATGGDTAEQQHGGGQAGGGGGDTGGGTRRGEEGRVATIGEGGDNAESPQWDQVMVDEITKAGLFCAIKGIEKGLEQLFKNAGPISRHHFASRRVKLANKTVVLGETAGEERVEAITVFCDQVIDAMGEGVATNREACISTVHALIGELCPEADKVNTVNAGRARAHVGRDDNADRSLEANRALAAAFATEAAGAEKRKREMAPEERQNRLKSWNATLSVNGTPKPFDCPHLQQQKVLTVEVEENKSYPVNPNTQPLRICDADDVHKKAGKNEDIVGADTKSVLTGRNRVDRWACGIAVAAANLTDREEVYGGACAISKAVRNATNVTTMELLQSVMDTAMSEGRKAYEGEYGPPVSLGQAFQVAAQTVARQDSSIGVHLTASRVNRDTGKDKKERTTFKVKLPDGTKKPYKILAGGNPDCPVACTRKSCKKGSKCAFNHKDLA